MGWKLDASLYPRGGTGLIGMWKAFELEAMGFVGPHRPRLCGPAEVAPIVKAFADGLDEPPSGRMPRPRTAPGPRAIGDFLMLRAAGMARGLVSERSSSRA
jgi:hypothetical protein